jgi:hypothetical protein
VLGIILCPACAPFAWWQGQMARKEIQSSGGALGGSSAATAGWIMGIIGTGLLALYALIFIIAIAVGASSA